MGMETFRNWLESEKLIEESMKFQIEQGSSITENTFRVGSESWCKYWKVLKQKTALHENLSDIEKEILQSDIGLKSLYGESEILLDYPYINEKYEDVELNSPKRGGSKKYYVYVKNDKGNIIKVEFGDTTGLQAKINNPEAVKSFVARHDCANKTDKTTPGFWSCRLPFFSKQLGLQGGGKYYW